MKQNPITNLRAITAMTPAERQQGRYMRAPDGHDGAPAGFIPNGTQTNTQNNQQGNNAAAIDDSNKQNNTSDEFDPLAFWNTDDGGDEDAPGNRDSATSDSKSSSTGDNKDGQKNFGQKLAEQINSTTFDDVFTADIVKDINEGNLEGANRAISENLREAIRQSLSTNVQVLKQFRDDMINNVQGMITNALTGQQNSDYLIEQIPSAKNPKVAPAIRAIYNHALERSKGDREAAVKATKAMMRTLSSETAEDIGFDVSPTDPHAVRKPPAVNWMEELNER